MNVISLRDLEILTEKLYSPNQDKALLEYADNLRETFKNNYSIFADLFTYLLESQNHHCLFWILDTLVTVLNSQYKQFQNEEKAKFRETILFIIENHIQKIFIAPFIESKFCVLLITFIKHDYPENWPSFFKDFINVIFMSQDENLKILKATLLVDTLLTFNDELVKFRHTYSEYEGVRSTLIKDYMRLETIGECVQVLNQLMQNEKFFTKKLIKNSIRVIGQLIDWNALNLFEESVKIITGNLINQNDYKNESLEVLNAIVEKGMEPNQKIELIKYLNINDILNTLLKETNKLNDTLLFRVCEIVGNIGNFLIESFEMVKSITKGEGNNNLNPNEVFNYVCELANNVLFQTIQIINLSFKFEIKTALNLCDFISNFTTYLKSNEFIAETFNDALKTLTTTIETSLIIPSNEYDIMSSFNKDEDDFFTYRKEFSVIYQNFFNINSLKVFILTSIINRINKIQVDLNQNEGSAYEVELALHLAYTLQSAILNADIQNSAYADYYNKLLVGLFTTPFSNMNCDAILILFYDTVYKYMQYIINNDNIILYVIKMYLSKQGIMHDNPIVGSKICNSFDKFVEKIKTQLGKLDIIYEISDTLRGFLRFLCTENKNIQLLSEYNVLFKTLCVIILQKNFNEDKRNAIFQDALSLFDLIVVNFGLDVEKFIELCKIITNFIKGIGYELNPSSKLIFLEYFNNFINNIYLKFTKNTDVDYSMLTIIQRLITILGKDSLQYVEYFITQQIKFPEYEMYEDFCKLLINSSQLLKKDSKSLIGNTFHYFFSSIKNVKLPTSNISEIEKNIISIYQTFVKLVGNITQDIVEVLFEQDTLKNVNLEELINFLIYIAYESIDPNIRRSIVKSLKSIVIHIIKLVNIQPDSLLLAYMQNILSGTFTVYSRLNLADPIDYNTLPEIVQLHLYAFKGVGNFYVGYIQNYLGQENTQHFLEHLNVYDVKKFKVGDVLLNYFNFISSNNFK